MRTVFILLFALMLMKVTAQQSTPLQVAGSGWRYVGWTLEGSFPIIEDVYTFIFNGDTLIDSKIYHKYYFSLVHHLGINPGTTIISSAYNGCLRSEGEQVFYIAKDSLEELLLFDYSLTIGDTVPQGQFCDTINRVITDTLTVEMEDGSYRLKYILNHWLPRFYIYGVGYETGLLQPESFIIHPYTGGTDFPTYCENGVRVYHKNVGGFLHADNCDFPVNIHGRNEHEILNVYPNPCNTGMISINSRNHKDIVSHITIINQLGLTVQEFHQSGDEFKELDISGLNEGFYFLVLHYKDNSSACLSFIVY